MTRAFFMGDSLTSRSLQTAACGHLGWTAATYDPDAQGGSGYLNPAADTTFINRISRAVAATPDVVVIIGSGNDEGYGIEATTAAYAAFFAAFRAALPNVELYTTGTYRMSAAFVAALSASTRAAGGTFVDFGDVAEIPRSGVTRWMTGTGNEATPAGDGNRDVYMQAGNVHPTDPAGTAYLGMKFAFAIRPPSTGLVEL